MEIDKNQGIQIDAYVNQVHDKQKTGAGNTKADKTAGGTDTVVISDAAKRVQEARGRRRLPSLNSRLNPAHTKSGPKKPPPR